MITKKLRIFCRLSDTCGSYQVQDRLTVMQKMVPYTIKCIVRCLNNHLNVHLDYDTIYNAITPVNVLKYNDIEF